MVPASPRTPATLVVLLSLFLLVLAGCAPAAQPRPTSAPAPSPASTNPAAPAPAGTLNVVATTTHLQDFVSNVGGDRVTVVPILGPSEDTHDYQPTAADARAFAQSNVAFLNGIGLEPWGDDLAKNVRAGTPVVKLGEESGISVAAGDEPGGDPHVWQDPTNVQKMVDTLRDTLSRLDAPGAPVYQANAAAYSQQLDQLDQHIQQQIATIPPDQRKLVTNHDALGYYVRRYGLTFVGSIVPSISSDAEPSAGEVQKLVEAIKAQHVKAIFTETNLNPKLEEQIAREAGVEVHANLYADALGPAGSAGDTYVKAMQFNTQVIVEGLR